MLKVGPRTRYHTNDRLDKKFDDNVLSIIILIIIIIYYAQ